MPLTPAPCPLDQVEMAPTRRYAGNDWRRDNALRYYVWDTPPVYADDGVTVLESGVLRPLDGCTVVGEIRYQTRCAAPAPFGPGLVAPVGAVVDVGIIELSLDRTQTVFPRQDRALWNNGNPDPRRANYIVQPSVIDADGNLVSIGLQPLFVF